jgi:hypothetical protein
LHLALPKERGETRPLILSLLSDTASGTDGHFPYGWRMSIAGQFITGLQREQKIGNVSSETEQRLKHEFRKLGSDALGSILAAAVEAEIERLERQAVTLRRLRETLLDVA